MAKPPPMRPFPPKGDGAGQSLKGGKAGGKAPPMKNTPTGRGKPGKPYPKFS